MAKLEIDEEDVQKEMEKECQEVEVQPYRKTDYELIIIINIIKLKEVNYCFIFVDQLNGYEFMF